MANWASVEYVIEGSKEDIAKIYDAVQEPKVAENSSKDWEGNVLLSLGVSEEKLSNCALRGFIQDSFLTDECILKLYSEEAWGLTDFKNVLGDLFPDISIYWYIEEPGFEIYETNDSEGEWFSSRYVVDFRDMEYFDEEQDMFDWLSNKTDGEVFNFDSLDKFNNDNEDDMIFVHKIEVVD